MSDTQEKRIAEAVRRLNLWHINKRFPGGVPADPPELVVKETIDQDRAAVIAGLQELADVRCAHGNWNYDPYMHGMANGLILALATLKGEEVKYLDAPEQWLKDLPAAEADEGGSENEPKEKTDGETEAEV